MEKLLDAYAAWPTDQQMTFGIVVLLLGSVLSFVWGWWAMMFARDLVYYISVWFRGWPNEPRDDSDAAREHGQRPWQHLLAWFSWRAASPDAMPDPVMFQRDAAGPDQPLPPLAVGNKRVSRIPKENGVHAVQRHD